MYTLLKVKYLGLILHKHAIYLFSIIFRLTLIRTAKVRSGTFVLSNAAHTHCTLKNCSSST